MMVLVLYPIARRYSGHSPDDSLGRSILRSVLDWRAIGLVFSVVAIVLSTTDVRRPEAIERYHVIDILIYVVNALAYFSIGLRLRITYVGRMFKMLIGLGVMRFGVSLGVSAAMLGVLRLTPWPMEGLRADIVLIQAMVPTAVTNVAIANMFDLRPREASVLFVFNTLTYLLVVLPVVFWVFG